MPPHPSARIGWVLTDVFTRSSRAAGPAPFASPDPVHQQCGQRRHEQEENAVGMWHGFDPIGQGHGRGRRSRARSTTVDLDFVRANPPSVGCAIVTDLTLLAAASIVPVYEIGQGRIARIVAVDRAGIPGKNAITSGVGPSTCFHE